MRTFNPKRFSSQQNASPRVRVERHGDEFHVRLQCSDDFTFSALVSDFKLHIDPARRRFDAVAKCWVVTGNGKAELRQFVAAVQGDYDGKILWPGAESATGDEILACEARGGRAILHPSVDPRRGRGAGLADRIPCRLR